MKLAKRTDPAGPDQAGLSPQRRLISLSRLPWRPTLRDLGIAVLITLAWMVVVGLGVCFWAAVIWLVAR
jgi:hypothetical protein